MDNNKPKIKQLTPSLWVGSLYFIEGLPYTLVNIVSVDTFKTMQISNSHIGLFTSLLYLPWMFKFIWAPIVNFFGKLRSWIIILQVILSALTFALSFVYLERPSFLLLCLVFALIALASATYDIACDGYYLATLAKDKQALYVGWRNTAYKMAWIFGSGIMVYIAGKVSSHNYLAKILPAIFANVPSLDAGWFAAFFIAGVILLLAAVFHFFQLPDSADNIMQADSVPIRLLPSFKSAFSTFFQQPKIILILAWILTFRTGDAMLLKMAQPFLLDSKANGGIGLSLTDVGLVYGSIGMIFLLIGGIAGSWLVFKYGLKKCLMPAALIQSLTLLLYWLLAIYKPGLIGVALANAFEQFIYGVASTAYISYLFTIVKDKFLTSHYAIATGFMAVGIMLPGAASGYLADGFGYQQFFLISFFCSLPGIFLTSKLPFGEYNGRL